MYRNGLLVPVFKYSRAYIVLEVEVLKFNYLAKTLCMKNFAKTRKLEKKTCKNFVYENFVYGKQKLCVLAKTLCMDVEILE